GGHHVAAYTFSQQVDRAVLHSRRAIHDGSQPSDCGDGDRPSSEPIDDVDPRRNHAGGWAGNGSCSQYLVGRYARRRGHPVGWVALVKSLFFLFLPPEMGTRLFLQQLHYQQLFYLYGAISLALGVYLTYGGFKSRSH